MWDPWLERVVGESVVTVLRESVGSVAGESGWRECGIRGYVGESVGSVVGESLLTVIRESVGSVAEESGWKECGIHVCREWLERVW